MTTRDGTVPDTTAVGLLRGLLRAMRPKQWVKNVLVFAAPFVAGDLLHGAVLLQALLAFVGFTLAAAGVYLVNDAKDVELDRAHPRKRHRPIASGVVPVPVAFATGFVLLLGGLAVSLSVNPQLVLVVAIYEAVQLSYCYGLKHQRVIEMCFVASGFLIRSIAGGVATSIPLSQWFLLITAFGSLFMVAGKRYAELLTIEQAQAAEGTRREHRAVLHGYTSSYLRFVWSLSATAMMAMYALWAFDIHRVSGSVWSIISMIPFVIAVLRYAVDVDSGQAEAPEDRVLGDRALMVLGACWVACLVLAEYVF
ncbi:MAG: decaprenyl-phosphate phosphoribosyltransferase [Sciscionella sp.]